MPNRIENEINVILVASLNGAEHSYSEYPEISKSVLNFGRPSLYRRFVEAETPGEIEHELSRIITESEPRIIFITFRVKFFSSHPTSFTQFEYSGEWRQFGSDPMYFKGHIRLNKVFGEIVRHQGVI